MNWASAVGKMAPIDLLEVELHNLLFVKLKIFVKHTQKNEVGLYIYIVNNS